MKFKKRPIALPANYRFFYQISIILLILNLSCLKKTGCSSLKFQLLAWVLRDKKGCKSLLRVTKNKANFHQFKFWALDPSLNRAISFALADGFLLLKNDKCTISPKGEDLLTYIVNSKLFTYEIHILNQFGKSVTEKFVTDILRNENA